MRKLFGLLFLSTTLTMAACGDKDEDGDDTTSEDGGSTSDGGGGGGSVVEDFCNAMDECNMLEGQSAGECAANLEACADDLLSSEASDFEAELEDCLNTYSSCDDLNNCYWTQVPYC